MIKFLFRRNKASLWLSETWYWFFIEGDTNIQKIWDYAFSNKHHLTKWIYIEKAHITDVSKRRMVFNMLTHHFAQRVRKLGNRDHRIYPFRRKTIQVELVSNFFQLGFYVAHFIFQPLKFSLQIQNDIHLHRETRSLLFQYNIHLENILLNKLNMFF